MSKMSNHVAAVKFRVVKFGASKSRRSMTQMKCLAKSTVRPNHDLSFVDDTSEWRKYMCTCLLRDCRRRKLTTHRTQQIQRKHVSQSTPLPYTHDGHL